MNRTVTRPWGRQRWLVLALALASARCGSDSNPAAAPTPSPTPTPRITLPLDAPADHYRFSPELARLAVGQTFVVTLRPLVINNSPDEQFAHAVELWLWSTTSTSENYTETAMALSFQWVQGSEWALESFTPGIYWGYTGRVFQIPFGQERTVAVTRRPEGMADFFVDGSSVFSLPDSEATRIVRARVVGAAAEVVYVPLAARALSISFGIGESRPQACAALACVEGQGRLR